MMHTRRKSSVRPWNCIVC